MTFTTTPPTTPGFYAFKTCEEAPIVCDYFDLEMIEEVQPNTTWLWLRLVPADEYVKKEEMEKAFEEGCDSIDTETDDNRGKQSIKDFWNRSRAKRIAEGKE